MFRTASLALLLSLFAGAALAEDTPNENISPAPSGDEQGYIYTGTDTWVNTPGEDYPVDSVKSGNVEYIDFGSDYEPASEPDTTIEYEPITVEPDVGSE
jgi:hypothetical protein